MGRRPTAPGPSGDGVFLTDEKIRRHLARRAGPSAPADLAVRIATSIASTPKSPIRSLDRRPPTARYALLGLAAAIAVVMVASFALTPAPVGIPAATPRQGSFATIWDPSQRALTAAELALLLASREEELVGRLVAVAGTIGPPPTHPCASADCGSALTGTNLIVRGSGMEHQVANDPRRTGVFAVRVAERATVDFVDSVALPDKGFSWSVEELRGDASMRIFDAHVVRAWLVDSTSPECARPSEHVPTGQHLAWLTDSGWRPAASGGYAEQCPVGAVRVQNDASDVFSSVDSSIGLGTPQLGTFVVAVGAGDPMPACPTPLGCIQFIDRTMGRILGRLDPIELPGPVAASADASRSPAIAPTSSLPFAPTQPPSQVTSIWSPVTLPAVPGQSTVSGTTGGGRDRGERRPAGYSPVPMHRKTA